MLEEGYTFKEGARPNGKKGVPDDVIDMYAAVHRQECERNASFGVSLGVLPRRVRVERRHVDRPGQVAPRFHELGMHYFGLAQVGPVPVSLRVTHDKLYREVVVRR